MVEIRFSASEIALWRKYRSSAEGLMKGEAGLRTGQSFFNWFNCHKVTNQADRNYLDVVYNTDGQPAFNAIAAITDYEN